MSDSRKPPKRKRPSLGAMTSAARALPKVGLPKVGLRKVGVPGFELPAAIRDASSAVTGALLDGTGSALDATRDTVGSSFGLLKATVGGLPLLGLATTSKSYDHSRTDEKHYFLLTDPQAEFGYALFVMRCLPDGVPPVNDLPKRRLLHLPGDEALPMLQHIVTQDARAAVQAEGGSPPIAGNIDALIDEIDSIDHKVFGGALAIGGLVAFANPLAGAAIAAKALAPSLGLMAAKYGLKAASRTATNLELSRAIKRAERDVARQFKAASTLALINPILHHLDAGTSLDMWMLEAERFRFDAGRADLGEEGVRRLCSLTLDALARSGTDAAALDYAGQVSAIVSGGAVEGPPAA